MKDQAEKGSSYYSDLIKKGLNGLFNSPQEYPKVQISDRIPDKKRRSNTFESDVYRCSLC